MIKFFSKIRKALINEGKTTKYLKYALGEIVLVVIGILIALQINNWNEQQQKEQELLAIYLIVQDDLKKDIQQISNLLESKKSMDSVFDKVFDGKMTKEDYIGCTPCVKLIFGFQELAVEQRGANLLNNFANNVDTAKDSLQIEINQFYTNAQKWFTGDDAIRQRSLTENIFYWESNYDWYADYALDRDYSGFIDYALTDKDYINRVATFYLLQYQIYVPTLEYYRKKAKNIVSKIDDKLMEQTGRSGKIKTN